MAAEGMVALYKAVEIEASREKREVVAAEEFGLGSLFFCFRFLRQNARSKGQKDSQETPNIKTNQRHKESIGESR